MIIQKTLERKDILTCALCKDAPCNEACPECMPERALRGIWFDNEDVASLHLPQKNPCISCDAPCEKACIRPGRVPIKKTISVLIDEVRPKAEIDLPENEDKLKCDFCGITLENPFLLSSSVVSSNFDMCDRAFSAGWAGACYKTICNFDIHNSSPRFSSLKGAAGNIIGFKNIEQLSEHSVAEDMETIRRLKDKHPDKFILASIMGRNEEEWEELAALCEKNGADAIELNFSCPHMQQGDLGASIGQVPEFVEQLTKAAKRGTKTPVIAKLTPNVERMSPAAEAAIRGGADGIAAINTINSVIGVSPFTYVSSPAVRHYSAFGGYSGNAVKPIALRFIAELGQNENMKGKHISAMGGIETWRDALEFILLGAGSVQVTTAVMQYGYRIIDDLKSGLNYYLMQEVIEDMDDIVGAGLEHLKYSTDSLEKDTILYPHFDLNKCNGCGRCAISCADGGHQAIRFEKRTPKLDGSRCVGCHLCRLVCPENAVSTVNKRIKRSYLRKNETV